MKDKNKNIPNCVGVIMDGNRRWAKEKGLPTLKGHTAGYDKLKDLVRWSKKRGIKNIIVYAFSTENWKRSEKEVSYLLTLFRKVVNEFFESLEKEKIRIKFFGDLKSFSKDLREGIARLEEKSKKYNDLSLFVALSYGGRAEILNSVNNILEESKTKKIKLTEKSFSEKMWSKGMPDPDLIIRTGGEMRLSNFLPWQSVCSELFFSKTYWPDFSEKEYDNILSDFSERERRFGR